MENVIIKETTINEEYIANIGERSFESLKEEFQVSNFTETELRIFSNISGFNKVCSERYSMFETDELMTLSKCINMTQNEANSFIEWIEKTDKTEYQNVQKAGAILKGIRSKKQRTNLVSFEELDYAVVNEDFEMLNNIFMTYGSYKIKKFDFRRADKCKLANRFFDAIKNTYGYVSFGSVSRAE